MPVHTRAEREKKGLTRGPGGRIAKTSINAKKKRPVPVRLAKKKRAF